MKYAIIDHKSLNRPLYQTRILISRNEFYIHPNVLGMTEVGATLDYFDATFVHKKHVYIGLLWLLDHSPIHAESAVELTEAITSSEAYKELKNFI
jgi:hypothetical protein